MPDESRDREPLPASAKLELFLPYLGAAARWPVFYRELSKERKYLGDRGQLESTDVGDNSFE